MKNGTKISHAKIADRLEATAITSPSKPFRNLNGTDKRPRRDPPRQKKSGSSGHVTDGFLKQVFLPRLYDEGMIPQYEERIVRDFYQSLAILKEKFGLTIPDIEHLGYPFNISLTLLHVKEQLKDKITDWDMVRLVKHEKTVFFAQEERFDTNMTLYYVPVKPLYKMLDSPSDRKSAELLLYVFSYLYHVANMPFHGDESTYIHSMYEMLIEMEEDNEEDYIDKDLVTEWQQAKTIADTIKEKICNRGNLKHFAKSVKNFKVRNSFEKECLEVAKKFLELYIEYPDLPFDCKGTAGRYDDEEPDTDRIYLENYFSFYDSGKGSLSNLLISLVNDSLQNYSVIDEPTIYKPFDGSILEHNNFNFENRLLTLICELCTILDTKE